MDIHTRFVIFGRAKTVFFFFTFGRQDERPRQAIPRSWPSKGLEMQDVFARHRPLLPAALSGVSLSVRYLFSSGGLSSGGGMGRVSVSARYAREACRDRGASSVFLF